MNIGADLPYELKMLIILVFWCGWFVFVFWLESRK